MSVTIGRQYRFLGDYEYVTDWIDAVERESCHGCTAGGGDVTMPSLFCHIAERVLGYSDGGDLTIAEWDEVERGKRIHCKARTEAIPGHPALLDEEDWAPACPTCHGEHRVLVERDEPETGHTIQLYAECPDCAGEES